MYKRLLIICISLSPLFPQAQELRAKVTVSATRVANNVNRNTFQTLQTALNNFLNNRKWTSDVYETNERIECNFFLNLESTSELNVYTASLMIQAARPVFNTNYLSPIINFRDENITFKYQEFQQLEFNENRVSGNDPLVSNLPAVFAYYAYMIIGFDGMSFSSHGGDVFFQKAQNIVNNAPDGRNISGWKPFDGIRNRYWLAENLLNSRYTLMQDIYYNYYRKGMDKLYEDENLARAELLKALEQLDKFNTENPNTMINQFFFQGKSTELIKIFSKASLADKSKASDILSRVDVTNAGKYKAELK
ncbi:MAG: DUF4835 family protein [Ferruginibacter sp.]|nr:DUF4835 family protein [Ferruginibacter sp.]